ncbi:MAG TPA: hypothetical protein VFC56_00495 [Stellaceae bacterium]|nr:hypothetical protein [Stellaceae bacterium]
MAKVNVNDRNSLERVYPREAFAGDAVQNDKVPNELRHGVRIDSAPDESGCFVMERATRHAGEPPTPNFLVPARAADPERGYQQFLDDIAAAAERFGFRADESPGQGDPRIRGLRQ